MGKSLTDVFNKQVLDNLIGKTIVGAKVDGFEVKLILDNGKVFKYYASDAGYSTWSISKQKED